MAAMREGTLWRRGGGTGNQKVQGGEVVVRAGPVEVEMVRNGRI